MTVTSTSTYEFFIWQVVNIDLQLPEHPGKTHIFNKKNSNMPVENISQTPL